MTNQEWVQSLSTGQLAKFLCSMMDCTEKCIGYQDCHHGHNGMVEWLKASRNPSKITDDAVKAIEQIGRMAHGEA